MDSDRRIQEEGFLNLIKMYIIYGLFYFQMLFNKKPNWYPGIWQNVIQNLKNAPDVLTNLEQDMAKVAQDEKWQEDREKYQEVFEDFKSRTSKIVRSMFTSGIVGNSWVPPIL